MQLTDPTCIRVVAQAVRANEVGGRTVPHPGLSDSCWLYCVNRLLELVHDNMIIDHRKGSSHVRISLIGGSVALYPRTLGAYLIPPPAVISHLISLFNGQTNHPSLS